MTFPALVHANIAKGMSVNVVYVNGNLIMDLIPLKDNTLIATAKLIKIIELSKLISAKKKKADCQRPLSDHQCQRTFTPAQLGS